jgi:hypothetical protein
MRIRVLALVLAAAIPAACAAVPPQSPLLQDCGGFVPPADLVDAASALGDPARRAAALADIEAMPLQRRVEVLRAGLRLRDVAAARSCAARLEWKQIDRWECARCVDLLVDGVLRPGDEASFEEFRSYLGSTELPRFLRSLPPLPWSADPAKSIAELHRIARVEHVPLYIELAKHPDAGIAEEALIDLDLIDRWNDDFREEVEAAFLLDRGGSPAGLPAPDGPGLPPVLAAGLRRDYLAPGEGEEPLAEMPQWDRRWLWECAPGPRDAGLLMELAGHGTTDWTTVSGVAYVLLGRLSDPETDSFLRRKAADGEDLACWALARRGDREMLERVVADAREDDGFALALLMEVDPPRARRLIEETLLGPDDGAAHRMLEQLSKFAVPGAFYEPLGFAWRRTSFAGFGKAAMDARIPALRLASIGATVPGCRTRALARAAALALRPGDLVEDQERWIYVSEFPPVAAFLETAAPGELTDALRRIRSAGGGDAPLATQWLVRMADTETCARVAATPLEEWPSSMNIADLARSRAPEVRKLLEDRVREALEGREIDDWHSEAVSALAVLHGLPETTAEAFFSTSEHHCPRAAAEAVLAGHPADALAAILVAAPDEKHGDVAAVDDPRVRGYLARLRARRDLGCYWYATGQLAVMGDAGARAEFWGAMQDGRYRIMNEADLFERTLGLDLAATMPFWIEELRSQCCRIVTSGAGDSVENLFGLDPGCFDSPFRTAYRRAKELWDAAEGRFVISRIAGYRVPEPR